MRYDTKADGSIDYSNITLGVATAVRLVSATSPLASTTTTGELRAVEAKRAGNEAIHRSGMVEMDNKLSKTESKLSGGILLQWQ